MQGIPSVAAGLLALLGSAALADELPVVKEARASWRGCVYRFQVLDDSASTSSEYPSGPPWEKNGKYKLVVQLDPSSFTCRMRAQTVEVSKAFEVPDVAIQVSNEGLAVAYSRGAYHPWTNYTRLIDIKRLDPVSLGTLKATDLYARFGQTYADYRPGRLTLNALTFYSRSIEVNGGLVGENMWGGGATQSGTGERFVASYLDFFGDSPQAPGIVIY